MTGGPPLWDGLPAAWAVEWGADRASQFMSFAVDGVVQRMRWISPGRFWMGSPASEAGREDDEGPRHEVEIARGFWLADTPCTQALWEVVMGSNPSRFKSPERPVEQVSWADCQAFLQQLEARVRGLGGRLPTEREWEYACRAGTDAATWAGDLTLRGVNDAPELDEIAWYGGNGGHGYELTEGMESRGWPQKQYPHEKAGTRPVLGRKANPLGLHDMLGNVLEWCADWYGPYTATFEPAPAGPLSGTSRVLRGGSWSSYARGVRAAQRYAVDPGGRDSDVGFRLARGQDP